MFSTVGLVQPPTRSVWIPVNQPVNAAQLTLSQTIKHAKDKNLKNYAELKRQYQFPDLQQLAKNNRGRGETIDCALPTLTTNSGKLYSKQRRHEPVLDTRR